MPKSESQFKARLFKQQQNQSPDLDEEMIISCLTRWKCQPRMGSGRNR